MLAQLFHAEEACGTATVGSSEAILLGGLAMKRRWQARACAGHSPSLGLGSTPNLGGLRAPATLSCCARLAVFSAGWHATLEAPQDCKDISGDNICT